MEVRRYLQHVNMDYEPPGRAPPRMVEGELDLVEELSYGDARRQGRFWGRNGASFPYNQDRSI